MPTDPPHLGHLTYLAPLADTDRALGRHLDAATNAYSRWRTAWEDDRNADPTEAHEAIAAAHAYFAEHHERLAADLNRDLDHQQDEVVRLAAEAREQVERFGTTAELLHRLNRAAGNDQPTRALGTSEPYWPDLPVVHQRINPSELLERVVTRCTRTTPDTPPAPRRRLLAVRN